MKITRKDYFFIIGPDGELLKKPDGSIRRTLSKDECYEYITEDARQRGIDEYAYTIKQPDYEVIVPKLTLPGGYVVIEGGNYDTSSLDSTPNQFTFTDQDDVPVDTLITSDEITVEGIDVGAQPVITVDIGEYQVNGGAWLSAPGIVGLDDIVIVRHTSSVTGNGTPVNQLVTIGGVSDTFTSTTGGYSTITGSGFGAKPASTIYYDDFESYPVGVIPGANNPIGGNLLVWHWGPGVSPDGTTIVSDEQYQGSKSLHHDFTVEDWPHFVVYLPETNKKVYMGCMTRIAGSSGSSGDSVWKYARSGCQEPGGENVYRGLSRAGESYVTSNSPVPLTSGAALEGCTNLGSGDADVLNPALIQSEAWQFYEHEADIGDYDVANGVFTWRWNMQTSLEWANVNFLCAAYPNLLGWILFPLHGHDDVGTLEMWLDSYYIDDGSRARVIMTDAATYANSTKWAHQIPTNWLDDEITITTKRGVFDVDDTAYLHIFDDDGILVDSQGPITVVEDV